MKKTVSTICGALLAVALVACGGSSSTKSDSTMPKQTGDSTMTTPPATGDQTAQPPAEPNQPAPDQTQQPQQQPQPPK